MRFTPENAREFSRLGNLAIANAKAARREAESEAERQAALHPANPIDDARKARTLKQLDSLDDMLDKAQRDKDTELVLRLTAAKERLWRLVTPTAGVMRPRQSSQRRSPPTVERMPQEPAPALAVGVSSDVQK